MKLTDTQLEILRKAASHPERLCIRAARLSGGARERVTKALINQGLATAMPRGDRLGYELWHFDGEDFLLRITDAGLRAVGAEPEAERAEAAEAPVAEAVANAPRAGRAFWRAAEEAAARGEIPPAPDLSAPTHAPYRRKLEKLLDLARAGDAAGLRAVAINATSTTPKALARWRDLAVRAIETRGA